MFLKEKAMDVKIPCRDKNTNLEITEASGCFHFKISQEMGGGVGTDSKIATLEYDAMRDLYEATKILLRLYH